MERGLVIYLISPSRKSTGFPKMSIVTSPVHISLGFLLKKAEKIGHRLLHRGVLNLITKCLLKLSMKPFDETNSL